MNQHESTHFVKSFGCIAFGARLRLENWVFASPAQERLKLIDFGLATRIVGEGWSFEYAGWTREDFLDGTC